MAYIRRRDDINVGRNERYDSRNNQAPNNIARYRNRNTTGRNGNNSDYRQNNRRYADNYNQFNGNVRSNNIYYR